LIKILFLKIMWTLLCIFYFFLQYQIAKIKDSPFPEKQWKEKLNTLIL